MAERKWSWETAAIVAAAIGLGIGGIVYVAELKGKVDALDPKAIETAHKIALAEIDGLLEGIESRTEESEREIERLTTSIETIWDRQRNHFSDHTRLPEIKAFTWSPGENAVEMIPASDGLCFLSGVSLSDTEKRREDFGSVYVTYDKRSGYWVLDGVTSKYESYKQETGGSLGGTARCWLFR